uniref:L-threonine dehydratase n=1 Tax=Candidatus Kentrum sp. TUN TaxID=2126343 RepID=A0A450ZCM3_9GAMM|nr:MAG: L-threonine ammonia-lyase [Candidatus Kentron sp. TUN]VFK51545.1 MAG: L-threonine ammonia-lyase [Candidatus Kentron sp. TUN]VFK55978.1 MAG: L-threonine ammonia-lyase [Candidatus Kentron sp. TUN]
MRIIIPVAVPGNCAPEDEIVISWNAAPWAAFLLWWMHPFGKTMFEHYLERILKSHVYDVAIETPLDAAPILSRRLGNRVLLKREDLQPVFSFKLRGAYNKIAGLGREARGRGVIAASAGNHAQGVALAANRLGVKALIVMPVTTPRIKVNAVRDRGAEIVLYGNTYDEARIHAEEIMEKHGMIFVHPYDDVDVIAGQGTIAMEIFRQHTRELYAIFVPVGGGGLIAGIAAYTKALWPNVKIIGVEPDEAPCMYEALRAKERVVLDQVGIFADGVAVRQVGEEPFSVAREYVDEVLLVNTDEICAAIKDIYDDTRSIAEPAGALGIAGLKNYVAREGLSDKALIAIDSGANVNFDRLQHIAERAELGERREALLAVTIPERPGSFLAFCHTIGQRSITEFNYRYAERLDARVFVGVELREGDTDKRRLIDRLEAEDYDVVDMSDNEMAKLHIRHMVGGRAQGVSSGNDPANLGKEQLYRFQFPERPGALLRFLTRMGQRWNISMFHYRNHGAAYGRVLVGIQIPDNEAGMFQVFLDDIKMDYPFWQETENPAYGLFLR